MNHTYYNVNETVIVSDENGKIKLIKNIPNIDEILVQENVIEEIEKKIEEFTKLREQKKNDYYDNGVDIFVMIPAAFYLEYTCYPMEKKLFSSLGPIPVVDTIIGPIDYIMIAIIVFNIPLVLSSLCLILKAAENKTNIYNEANGIDTKIEFLKTYLEEKKETLTALKNKSLNIQDNIIIQSDSATNTNSAAEVPITVDDTDALKELQELIHFSYDLGYNLKLYYELYQKGEIEKELKNSNHTDSEIKFAKKYLKEKGPVLVKRRNY